MDYSLLIGEKGWTLLEILAEESCSPNELARRMAVTPSYVSQQLKMLEIAGLVESKKTGLTDKGKPRKRYFVKKGFVDIKFLDKNGFFKKSFDLDEYSKAVLRILSLNNKYHFSLQRFFWNINFFDDFSALFFDESKDKLIFVSDKKILQKAKKILKENSLEFEVDVVSLFNEGAKLIYCDENFQRGKNEKD